MQFSNGKFFVIGEDILRFQGRAGCSFTRKFRLFLIPSRVGRSESLSHSPQQCNADNMSSEALLRDLYYSDQSSVQFTGNKERFFQAASHLIPQLSRRESEQFLQTQEAFARFQDPTSPRKKVPHRSYLVSSPDYEFSQDTLFLTKFESRSLFKYVQVVVCIMSFKIFRLGQTEQ